MTINIIIPAFNEEKNIGSCLESLLHLKMFSPEDIFVVDNGSTDNTKNVASSFGVTVLSELTKGTNNARQCGFRYANADILCFIDADCIVPSGWKEKAIHVFQKYPRTVCISGPYYFHDAGSFIRICTWMYWYLCALPVSCITRYMAVGGNMAVRREALEKIGGFDTSLTFYGDDTDLARRLKSQGNVFFSSSFVMYSSARRLKEHGVLKTGWLYVKNFLSQVFLQSSVTKHHIDVRD